MREGCPLTAGSAAARLRLAPFAGGPLGAYTRLNKKAAPGRHLTVPPAAREALAAIGRLDWGCLSFRQGASFLVRSLILCAGLCLSIGVPGPLHSQARPELLWELGRIEGPAHEMFEYLSDGAIVDSTIVVVAGRGDLRRYDLRGGFLGWVGRSGEGPGEFQGVSRLRVYSDTIEVYDPFQGRTVLFGVDGATIETISNWSGAEGASMMGRVSPVWRKAGVGTVPVLMTPEIVDLLTILVKMREGGARDTLTVIPSLSAMFRFNENTILTGTPAEYGMGPAGGFEVLGDSFLALLDGESGRMKIYEGEDLALRSQWALPTSYLPVDEETRGLMVAAVKARFDNDPRIRDIRVPDHWASWTGMEDGRDGSIWIRRGGPDHSTFLGESEEWVQWTLEGRQQNAVELPAGIEGLAFADALILARRTDEFDVHYLQLYEVRR